MATATMAYGERRFGAAYTIRILLALGVLGLVVGLWAAQDDPRISVHPGLLIASVALLLAVCAIGVVLSNSVLIINDSGIRRESAFGQTEITWDQIMMTRYRVVAMNVYAHLGLIGAVVAMTSKSGAQFTLELISHDGRILKVTSNFRDADEAVGIILARILPPMVQTAKAKLQRGETVHFGGIDLSATTITWKGRSIPLSQIAKAELVRSNLQIKQQGKWRAAISVRSDRVPDVLVFLELLEFLAPQIKSAGINPLVRVRM